MSTTTIAGNLTTDPTLRFTSNGTPVANFTIAHTPRRYDKASGAWVDGDTLFLRSTVWGKQAEAVAESLTKGTRVVATGALSQSSYTDADGNTRTSIELEVDEVGPSLRWANASAGATPVVQAAAV